MNDPIRVGVIGAGAIAQVAHLPALRRMAGVEVVAICDNDIAKARALAGRFEVRDSYDDIEDVLRYASVDAVVICTPNHLHEIHAMAALAAGAHVLCERPLALTLQGVERLLQATAGTRSSRPASWPAGACAARRRVAVRSSTSGCSCSTWACGSPAGRRRSASPRT